MRIREAKYNADRNQGTYGNPVHFGEVISGSTVLNDAPSALTQNLAGPDGLNLAKRLFARRKKS